MITDFTQRWTRGGKPVYRPVREYFNPFEFSVEAIDFTTAKNFIESYHYLKTMPAARRSFGLFQGSNLVGTAVYSHPMNEKVITNVFGCKSAAEGAELGRLVILDEIKSNAESFFVAECHRRLKKEGFCGVVSFADDVARRGLDGSHFLGHIGTVYQSLNSVFLGRSTPTKLHLLPDGKPFSRRTISKIRAGESGWQYSARILESFGAETCPDDDLPRKNWLKYWLERLTTKWTHPGNLRYSWDFSSKNKMSGLPYPKIRFSDIQRNLQFT